LKLGNSKTKESIKADEDSIMGLDVYLCRFSELDTAKIALYSQKCNQLTLNSSQYNNPTSPLVQKEVAELSERYLQLSLEIGLPSDIDKQIQQNEQQVELPSVKYPQEYRIGYWGSGYGGGGIDTILKTTIGSGLYDAFPEAKGKGTYLKPDWDRSLQILQDMLSKFQSKGFEDQNFLYVTGFSIELGLNFVSTLTPSSPEKQALLTELEDCFTPQSQFNDYVKELEVMIETVEYVLVQSDREQYVLCWCA
jgi:hypothetical protein